MLRKRSKVTDVTKKQKNSEIDPKMQSPAENHTKILKKPKSMKHKTLMTSLHINEKVAENLLALVAQTQTLFVFLWIIITM